MTLAQANRALAAATRRLGQTPTPVQWARVYRRFSALHRRLRIAGAGYLDLEPLMLLRPRKGAVLPD